MKENYVLASSVFRGEENSHGRLIINSAGFTRPTRLQGYAAYAHFFSQQI